MLKKTALFLRDGFPNSEPLKYCVAELFEVPPKSIKQTGIFGPEHYF